MRRREDDDTLYLVSGGDLSVVPIAALDDPPPPPFTSDSPLRDARLGDTLFFARDEPSTGNELWMTETVPGSASLLKDINPGPGNSLFSGPVVLGDRLFFGANDGSDTELWVSDGTEAGTRQFLDINPGGDSYPTNLTRLQDGRMIFTADNGANGSEIWVTDGSRAGTRLLVDVIPGGTSSYPHGFVELGDQIFFFARPFDGALYRQARALDDRWHRPGHGTTYRAVIQFTGSSRSCR